MYSTRNATINSISNSGYQRVTRGISHLLNATVDLGAALELTNVPGLFAARAEQLRESYRDLDALLAQLDAMRLQFAEYVELAEEGARVESPTLNCTDFTDCDRPAWSAHLYAPLLIEQLANSPFLRNDRH